MIIVYYSFTNQVKKFVSEIDKYECYPISDYVKELGEYILITPTHGYGDIPVRVKDFLQRDSNYENMVGVCASGKSIWKLRGTYCGSADKIHEQYGVPILLKFEMKGTDKDRELLFERIEQIEQEKLH